MGNEFIPPLKSVGFLCFPYPSFDKVTLVEIKDVSEHELKNRILKYIKEKGEAYPSDIAADMGVPYFGVTEIINRLVEEGVLEQGGGNKD